MNKNTWLVVFAVVIVIAGAYVYLRNPQPIGTTTPSGFDPLNATYTVEGQQITLVNGVSEVSLPGIKDPTVATKTTTKIFGQPVVGDLNGDGRADAAVFITQDSGGSGTFYYAVAAINTGNGAQGTNAIFLGDRIAPQNIEIKNGQIIVNYTDRKAGDSFADQPSVGVSRYMTVQGSALLAENAIMGAGGRCGGNMTTAPTCVTGYHCAPAPGSHLPFGDVGGTCVAN